MFIFYMRSRPSFTLNPQARLKGSRPPTIITRMTQLEITWLAIADRVWTIPNVFKAAGIVENKHTHHHQCGMVEKERGCGVWCGRVNWKDEDSEISA